MSPSDIVVVPPVPRADVTSATSWLMSCEAKTSKRMITLLVPEKFGLLTLNCGRFVVRLPEGSMATGASMMTGATILKLATGEEGRGLGPSRGRRGRKK